MPICRWFPPKGSTLEVVAYHSENETTAYRLRPVRGPVTVFFAERRPAKPVAGYYSRPLYMVPRLDLDRFLRPPFDGHKVSLRSEQLRNGIQLRRAMPVMPEVYVSIATLRAAESRGLWRILSDDDSNKSPRDDTDNADALDDMPF